MNAFHRLLGSPLARWTFAGLAAAAVCAALLHTRDTWMRELKTVSAKHLTIVVGRVLVVKQDGRKALVLGTDTCPGLDSPILLTVFGEPSNVGESQCIVFRPETKTVWVHVFEPGQPGQSQEWHVVREADRLFFRRDDGSAVIAEPAN
jgi:hypothetical protein